MTAVCVQRHRVAPSAETAPVRLHLQQCAFLSQPPMNSTAISLRSLSLLNSLLRRTCLSFPPFLLPCHLCSPLFPLPHSLTSAPGACPRDMAHRAPQHVCLDCTFTRHYSKRVCSFSCPLAGRLYLCLVEALCRGEEACSACPAIS